MNDATPENLSDLELVYKDQGYHEMEFTNSNESELHERRKQCQKNPGHEDFIPVKNFTLHHLPECWHDSLIFDLIITVISQTVRVAVGYTSERRPQNYPLYNRRGQSGVTAFGSGRVRYVKRKFKEQDNNRCPCKTCKQSPHQAKQHWGEFWVRTAQHVVFDSSEARHTMCNLFFDSDEDRYDCPSLEGIEVVDSNVEMDYCHLKCVTHDEDVCNKLEQMTDLYWSLHQKLTERQGAFNVDEGKTAVVISHPHGLAKYVTVGEVTDRVGIYKWRYSAETCTGSSGGPVCLLGVRVKEFSQPWPYNITHSGCPQKGQNESTSWFDLM